MWSLKRAKNYGSKHYDEHPLDIQSANLSTDGRTVTLGIPKLAPTIATNSAPNSVRRMEPPSNARSTAPFTSFPKNENPPQSPAHLDLCSRDRRKIASNSHRAHHPVDRRLDSACRRPTTERRERGASGERALKLLGARLTAIMIVVPEPALAKLRAVTIQVDLNHGKLRPMQYHPNAGWLKENGFSEALAKCAHIPNVEDFLSPFENHRMPWVVLHELAHAYHDQVIGFEEPRVRAAWEKFRDSGNTRP